MKIINRMAVKFKKMLQKEDRRILKTYASFAAALAAGHSYVDPDVVRVVSAKTMIFRDRLKIDSLRWVRQTQTTQNLFVLTFIDPHRSLEVLELGGACGATYMESAHLRSVPFKAWHIVETSDMAATAQTLFANETLRFYDTVPAAVAGLTRRDLILAQGVLQYTPDPLQTWQDLLRLHFSYVYLTRTHVAEKLPHALITVAYSHLSAHGPGLMPNGFADKETSQPLTLVSLDRLLNIIPEQYRLVYLFDEGNRSLRTDSGTIPGRMIGLLLEKIS